MWLLTSRCMTPIPTVSTRRVFPILKRHEGTFFTYDDNTVTFEGNSPREGRMVMFTFPSEAHAVAWYNDPDYQALSEHRRAGTELKFLTMVHGLPPRT